MKKDQFTVTSAISSACPQPIESFDLDFHGRYLKLVIDSHHGLGAGWQYLNIEFTGGEMYLILCM